MPTIVQLNYVLALHKHGHFGRAAQDLGVSQPTLSTQIQKIEVELGTVLFDRTSKPIRLTEDGEALIDHARTVVTAHEELLAAATEHSSTPRGKFALAIIPTLAAYVLPWFLSDFASRHPLVELSIFERPTESILEGIATSRIDAGILATPLEEDWLRERVLFYDPFYLYAHREDPILEREWVEVDDIDAEQLWLLEDGHCFRAQVLNFCGGSERCFLGSVRFTGGSFETLRHVIDASGGYTLVPETYARTLPRAVRQNSIRAFGERGPAREVSLIHHRRASKQRVMDALEESISRRLPRCFGAEPDGEVLPVRPNESA